MKSFNKTIRLVTNYEIGESFVSIQMSTYMIKMSMTCIQVYTYKINCDQFTRIEMNECAGSPCLV